MALLLVAAALRPGAIVFVFREGEGLE